MPHVRFLSICTSLALLAFVPSCDAGVGDLPSPSVVPPPEGKELRIREVAAPASPMKAPHESVVKVSGAVVIAVDKFDETGNGRSSGTIYVADLGSKEPYSGISLFNPSFIPGNLRVGPGDALDLRGVFQENQNIPITFAPGAFLVQLADAIGTFRFDAEVPPPVEIDINELSEYGTGRKWLNMLVTVKNVTVQGDAFGSSGRRSYNLLPQTASSTACDAPFPKPPTLVNELTDLEPLGIQANTVIKQLTGVVTFFCNLHIAPRSAADVVL
ncbi:MAG TPA: hypothetical protein VM580_14320 [Labilithrix sp.]|nr:hypothetical protein [Labilithrix sp.]